LRSSTRSLEPIIYNATQEDFNSLEQILTTKLQNEELEVGLPLPTPPTQELVASGSGNMEISDEGTYIDESSTSSRGQKRRRSYSDDSNRSDKVLKKGHFDKDGTSGGGDHTIPDRLMKETLYSIIDYEKARDIPPRINRISTALGLGNICENTKDIQKKFEEIKAIRTERKDLTRRLRGAGLILEDYIESPGEEKLDTVTIDNLINISPTDELIRVVGQDRANEETERAKELLNTASKIEEEKLKEIGNALHTTEANLYNEILVPIANDFLEKLDGRNNAIKPKERVAEQRKNRIEGLDAKIREKLGIYKPQKAVTSQNRLDYISTLQSEVGTVNEVEPMILDALKKDVDYANRIKGEGTRVRRAVVGLRAFGNVDIGGVPLKDISFKDIARDPNHPLWNITQESSPSNTTEENSTTLSKMCETAGMVFERTIDFERKLPDSSRNRRQREQDDTSQLGELYKTASEALVFMFQTFNSLANLDLNSKKQDIAHSFLDQMLSNQGWHKITRPFKSDMGEKISLREKAINEMYTRTDDLLSLKELSGNVTSNSNQIDPRSY
jgi:hypothetical protein